MVIIWCQYLSSSPETPSQHYSNYIKIEDAVIPFEKFSNKNINFLSQLFGNGRIISLVNLKDKYKLTNDMFFLWDQLKLAFPTRWKTLLSNYSDIDEETLCQNHVIIGNTQFIFLCNPQKPSVHV